MSTVHETNTDDQKLDLSEQNNGDEEKIKDKESKVTSECDDTKFLSSEFNLIVQNPNTNVQDPNMIVQNLNINVQDPHTIVQGLTMINQETNMINQDPNMIEQDRYLILNDPCRSKLNKICKNLDKSKAERKVHNVGGNAAFKLNNNLWKCELEINI
jgi:hypothetical protein